VLSGKLDDVGGAIPTNVKDSYRAGVELTTGADLLPTPERLRLSGNLTLARNRIRNYVDYLTNYDTNTEQATAYRETAISYSPGVISAATLESQLLPGLRVAALGKYVGRQYLDNTATKARSLGAYTVVDARMRYVRTVRFAGLREVEAAILVANVLSEKYASNGYTYGYVSGGERLDFTYLNPQATRNFLASLCLRW
jgi:iron complex outermembrane recepter protein